MSSRRYNDWLKGYLNYTRHSEAPNTFHFWTGVSLVAGALRRRVWIDQRYFQWVPNFYIVFVGPPGVATKTTTINVGMDLLREIDGVKFGPKVITWQALLDHLESAKEMVELVPGSMEFHPMSCLTCPVGELGTFLKPSNTEMIDVMVDLWDGQVGVFEKMTRTTKHNSIENPWINIIGCTTPAWLRSNFPEYMIGGGLTSRCVFVYNDTKRQLVPYPSEVAETSEFQAERAMLLEDLNKIALLAGEYTLAPDALQWGREWYEHHWTIRPEHMASDRYSGYLARKQTHIHKLAMVLSAAQGDTLAITEEHLAGADFFVSSIEEDMIKVFESIGVGEAAQRLQEVRQLIYNHGVIPQETLIRTCLRMMAFKEYEETINALVRAGYIRELKDDGVNYVLTSERPLQESANGGDSHDASDGDAGDEGAPGEVSGETNQPHIEEA